jgi:hypothetical protein
MTYLNHDLVEEPVSLPVEFNSDILHLEAA